MTYSKALSTISLALALMGGAVMLAPSSATAGTAKKTNNGFISNGALKHDGISCSDRRGLSKNCRPGNQANPHTRGCSKLTRCRD